MATIPLAAPAFWDVFPSPPETCPGVRTFLAAPSDVYISGLLSVHDGGRCGLVDPVAVQLLEAARWTTFKMGQVNFIPGVNLGVNVYDTCGGREATLRAAVSAVVEGGYLDPPHCRPAPHVGVLHAHPDHPQLSSFLKDVGVPTVGVGEEDFTPQLEALMPLLLRVNWTSVAVAAPSIQMLRRFGHLAARYRICVGAEALLPSVTSDQQDSRTTLEKLERAGTGGVVAVGPQHRLHSILVAAAALNFTNFRWVLAPTGPLQERVFQGLSSVASGVVALRRASQTVPEFGEHFLNLGASAADEALHPSLSPGEYVEEPAVFEMVEAVFRVGAAVRRAVKQYCGGSGWCPNATLDLEEAESEGLDVIEELSIKAQRPRYEVLRLSANQEGTLTFTNVGHVTTGRLELDARAVGLPQFPCLGCRCLNVRFSFLADLRWRSEAWVTICATMAIIGFLLAFAIIVFISARTCRGKASEGSQGFSILLLLSCIFLYAAILPYSFEASSLICALRPFATSLSYALMLAILLARSLMMATADSEGDWYYSGYRLLSRRRLVGHVSGLVQTALLFFMVAVQAGLGVQQWVMTPPRTFLADTPPEGGVLYACSGDRLYFLISLSYVMFLLLLQLLVSPFTIRSRRNYHEGLLFFVATLLLTGVWVAWATLFMLLPPVWTEACVCLGLAGTATCVLVSVFVPKTYLMVRASARESAHIRPLSRPQSSHDLVRASNLALYDSIGHLPEMMHAYSPDPTIVHLPAYKENPYEPYSHYQPSPHKVTQF
ncbi:uncharacterized protein LOC127001689 isoform X3 [Eriocheir sinensis]|nr:uncharacterized protein LOC127001689 isoform X3 [Eriocheir sinensis]XP_050722668.1 uncharacterized protein LOC127001689 isoform X3 [Eriocheir sinensis]